MRLFYWFLMVESPLKFSLLIKKKKIIYFVPLIICLCLHKSQHVFPTLGAA